MSLSIHPSISKKPTTRQTCIESNRTNLSSRLPIPLRAESRDCKRIYTYDDRLSSTASAREKKEKKSPRQDSSCIR